MQQSYHSERENTRSFYIEKIKANVLKYIKRMDLPLLILMLLIIIFGLVMVYSTTIFYEDGTTARSYPIGYLLKQSIAVALGCVGSIVVLAAPMKLFGSYKALWSFHIVLVAGLVATMIWGLVSKGARSWIPLGPFNFQPSEFTKISIMLLFSHRIYHTFREFRGAKELRHDKRVQHYGVWITVAMVLIGLQPDLGMLIIIGGTMFIMLMVNRLGWKGNIVLYSVIIGIFTFAQIIARSLGGVFSKTGFYQLKRLGSFVNPFLYVDDAGYQLTRAYIAFSRGGWFGVGLGQGLTNRAQLPERHTDFILAIVVEETGFIGAIILLSLLFALIIRLYIFAYRSQNIYHRCLLSGAGTLYLVQTLVNVGGAIGLLPLTGVTLPFVSYGGSSMMMCILLMAVAQRIIVADNIEREKRISHGI